MPRIHKRAIAFAKVDRDGVTAGHHGNIDVPIAVEVAERHGHRARASSTGRNGSVRIQDWGFEGAIPVGNEHSKIRQKLAIRAVDLVLNQVRHTIVVQIHGVRVAAI